MGAANRPLASYFFPWNNSTMNGLTSNGTCPMNTNNRTSFSKAILVRILFYGLFLVGPCALTESHALYTRMKQECAVTDGASANKNTYQEFRRKIALLDAVGISAFGLWFLWLGFAVGGQIKRLVQERRSKRSRKSVKGVVESMVPISENKIGRGSFFFRQVDK